MKQKSIILTHWSLTGRQKASFKMRFVRAIVIAAGLIIALSVMSACTLTTVIYQQTTQLQISNYA